VAEILVRQNRIAHTLLQFFGLRETVVNFAVPNDGTFCDDFKRPRFSRDQCDLANLSFKGP